MKKCLISFGVMILLLVGVAPVVFGEDDDIITINDKNFKAAVVSNFDRNNDGEISKSEAENGEFLSMQDQNITDISDITKFPNIKNLYLRGNLITDITPLLKLKNLQSLDIRENKIDFKNEENLNVIAQLQKKNVYIYYDDTSTIVKFNNIEIEKELISNYGIDENKDGDISYLELYKLKYFSFTLTKTEDMETLVEDLSKAVNLATLNISIGYENEGNTIIDLKDINRISGLVSLNLTGYINNLDKISNLTNLKELILNLRKNQKITDLGKQDDLEKLTISSNFTSSAEEIEEELANIPNLKELEMTNVYSVKTSTINLGKKNILQKLEKLCIRGSYNFIYDFSQIDNLKSLKNISLETTQKDDVLNIEKLKELSNLESLEISNYNSDDQFDLSKVINPNLKNIKISGYIRNIQVLEEVKNIETLYISDRNLEKLNESELEEYLDHLEKINIKTRLDLIDTLPAINAKGITVGESKQIYLADTSIIKRLMNKDSNLYDENEIKYEKYQSYDSSIDKSQIDISKNGKITITANEFGKQKLVVRAIKGSIYSGNNKINVNLEFTINWTNMESKDNVQEIEIPDENLKAKLLEKYDLDNDNKLTTNDLENLEEIDIQNSNISSLRGLENAINLKTINAKNNKIESIKPLTNLEKLETIDLACNRISDITPLKNKPNLSMGYLCSNLITDITPLKDEPLRPGGEALYERIDFSGNYINIDEGTENREALKNQLDLIEDENKWIKANDIRLFERAERYGSPAERDDVLEITDTLKNRLIEYGIDSDNDGNITKGEMNDYNKPTYSGEGHIYRNCKVDFSNLDLTDKDLECLKYLSCITELDLSNNQLTDVSPLKHIKNIDKLVLANNNVDVNSLVGIDSVIDLDLSNNHITDITALEKLKYEATESGWFAGGGDGRDLVLNLSNNNISNIEPITTIRSIQKINLANNKITDISILKDFDFTFIDRLGEVEDVYEDGNIQNFEGIDFSNNYINVEDAGNKKAIDVFNAKKVKLVLDNQKENIPKKGDFDGDGKVSIYDVVQILTQSILGGDLTDDMLYIMDYNGDGKVTIYDAIQFLNEAILG